MIQKHAEENYSDRHADFIMRQAEARLYGNLTTSVTEDDAAEDHSFLFRLGLSILCFACFVWMDYGKIEVAEVNSGRILNGIEKQITPKEMKEELIQVWKAL